MPSETPWVQAPKTSHLAGVQLRLGHPNNHLAVRFKSDRKTVYVYDNLNPGQADQLFLSLSFAEHPGCIISRELVQPKAHFVKETWTKEKPGVR